MSCAQGIGSRQLFCAMGYIPLKADFQLATGMDSAKDAAYDTLAASSHYTTSLDHLIINRARLSVNDVDLNEHSRPPRASPQFA
jgi:hypothetical protein